MSTDIVGLMQRLATPWPDATHLRRYQALQARLQGLPDQISGVDLTTLKNVALPRAIQGDWAGVAERLVTHRPLAALVSANDTAETVAAISTVVPADDTDLDALLLAARILHGAGRTGDAACRLLAAARVARQTPDGTSLALWLSEVADTWLQNSNHDIFRASAAAELGELVASTGDGDDGIKLLEDAALRFFNARSKESAYRAWTCRYTASYLAARVRDEKVATLRALNELRQEPSLAGTFLWYRAGFQIVALDPEPGSNIRATAEARALLDSLEAAAISADDKVDLAGHGDHALGYALSFGRNRALHAKAAEHYQKAIEHFRRRGHWHHLAHALDGHGRILSQLGEHERASEAFQECIALMQRLKDVWGLRESMNGLAESITRRGRPLDAIAYYDADLRIMAEGLKSPPVVVVLQNLGLKALAYLAPFQNPLDDIQPSAEDVRVIRETLEEYERQMQGQPGMQVSRAYHSMITGMLRRCEALVAVDDEQRRQRLTEAEAALTDAIAAFNSKGHLTALPNAEIALAGVFVDRAKPMIAEDPERAPTLAEAARALAAADKHVWDTYERAYLDLEWAAYYTALGQPGKAQRHLASARFHAEFCGNESINIDSDARLAVRLIGPTGDERGELILPPGGRLAMPFQALDWVGRPLPRYTLHASTHAEGDEPVAIDLDVQQATTDFLGGVTFTVSTPPDAARGTMVVQVEDRYAVRESRVTIHVRPFDIHYAPGLEARVALNADEQAVLRHLFGPRFHRVFIQKEFGGGKSGAKVLLVEPSIDPHTPDAVPDLQPLRAQRCIVKIGGRAALTDEVQRYETFVRDILPSNVSQFAGWAVWSDKAAIRMSLAGGQEWGRAEDEVDWLTSAPGLVAHHLLERVFAGDLASCWYSNGSTSTGGTLVKFYGPVLPVLVTLRDGGIAEGLLAGAPPAMARHGVEDGLRPPGNRTYQNGDELYLGSMKVAGWWRSGSEWRYELTDSRYGLRAAFHTPVPPEQMDTEGVAERLLGQSRHLRGRVQTLAFDELQQALVNCLGAFEDESGKVSLANNGQELSIALAEQSFRLPNPLLYLHQLLGLALRCRHSIIHGDLHTRNIIIGSQGLPYYIDFGKTAVGPTLFDFVKHEVYLWLWNFARWPNAAPPPDCTLASAVSIMMLLSDPNNRHPSPFLMPDTLQDPHAWLPRFFQCICTVRSQAQVYELSDEGVDYFAPLCLYAAAMLRWSDPAKAPVAERPIVAREGVLQALLAGMLLGRNMIDGMSNAAAS